MKLKIGLLPRLIIAIIAGILIGWLSKYFNMPVLVRLGATFNNIFGNFLNFAIPLIIIGFVTAGIAELGEGAGKTLGITVVVAYASTLIAGTFAYFVDTSFFPMFLKAGSIVFENAANPEEALQKALFTVNMPPLMDVMTALLVAFVFGIGIAVTRSSALKKGFIEVQAIIEMLVADLIIPLLPFHVLGIFANMTYAGTVVKIMSVFMRVFVIILIMHCAILLFQYTVAGLKAGKNPLKLMKNMIPAYLTAIGTQSSAATIPVTVGCTKNNGVSDKIAEFVCPLCATIHLSGSTITLTSCAIAMMMLNGMPVTFGQMFPFIMMLGIIMVAAPGVPGGAVMSALGILASMLHFNESMLSLMIALYIAQDSFGTACNCTGDGAIAVFIDSIVKKQETKILKQ